MTAGSAGAVSGAGGCVAPAETLEDYMTENGLTVNVLAVAVGGSARRDRSAVVLREVLARRPLTERHVAALSAATSTSPVFWRNYERNYRSALARGCTDSAAAEQQACDLAAADRLARTETRRRRDRPAP